MCSWCNNVTFGHFGIHKNVKLSFKKDRRPIHNIPQYTYAQAGWW